ncbi:MAG: toll/interleukin-1 receptor domain-containing protein, partial [Chloroflexi bacterium]|nr:toll/interleukin-1 receptor domain-containing protein [Chloroflexota bacterium]
MVKIFISYKREATPDEHLAHHLAAYLEQQGHSVFIDVHIPPGQEWSHVIQQRIEQADFFIVLLSQYSVSSDMVIHEVAIAYDHKNQHNAPNIIPIRIAYTTPYTQMPYNLGAMLAPIQSMEWTEDGDESTIGQKLNHLMHAEQLKALEHDATHTTDTHSSVDEPLLATPLPAFDAQWLNELDASGGAVQLESHFYVERQVDSQA